jgi:hypothetical protein
MYPIRKTGYEIGCYYNIHLLDTAHNILAGVQVDYLVVFMGKQSRALLILGSCLRAILRPALKTVINILFYILYFVHPSLYCISLDEVFSYGKELILLFIFLYYLSLYTVNQCFGAIIAELHHCGGAGAVTRCRSGSKPDI